MSGFESHLDPISKKAIADAFAREVEAPAPGWAALIRAGVVLVHPKTAAELREMGILTDAVVETEKIGEEYR